MSDVTCPGRGGTPLEGGQASMSFWVTPALGGLKAGFVTSVYILASFPSSRNLEESNWASALKSSVTDLLNFPCCQFLLSLFGGTGEEGFVLPSS